MGGIKTFSICKAESWIAAERHALAAQGFSPLADDVEITGIGEKTIPPLPGNFFDDPDSHQAIEGHRNCGNRESECLGCSGNARNWFPLHVFVDAQGRCRGPSEFLYPFPIFGKQVEMPWLRYLPPPGPLPRYLQGRTPAIPPKLLPCVSAAIAHSTGCGFS